MVNCISLIIFSCFLNYFLKHVLLNMLEIIGDLQNICSMKLLFFQLELVNYLLGGTPKKP